MDDKPMRELASDPNLASYDRFMDYEWARHVGKLTDGSIIEFPVFDLCMSWKGSSNTFAMPQLMVQGSSSFWTAYTKGHYDQSMLFTVIRDLSAQLCKEVQFTNMKEKEVRAALDRLVRRSVHAETVARDAFVFPTEELWQSYLSPKQPGTAEFHLILWTSQRLCFSSLLYAYEFFVQDVLRKKSGKTDSWRPFFSELVEVTTQTFGSTIADECLTAPDVESAKKVRNSLAHNGGRETDDLKGKHSIRVSSDGRLLIWPEDNRKLFNLLKDKATKIINAALN